VEFFFIANEYESRAGLDLKLSHAASSRIFSSVFTDPVIRGYRIFRYMRLRKRMTSLGLTRFY